MSGAEPSRSWRARLVERFRRRAPEAPPPPAESGPAPVPVNGGELLINVQAFDRLRVADVMVPRADIIAVEIDTPLGELTRLFAEAAHSRLPIYRETLDDPVGVVHIKDVVGHLAPGEDGRQDPDWAARRILPSIRRPLLFAPPSMRATDLLLRMQSRRMHLALVVDEYGGTDGLVTLEDLLEPIVGDIEDEHDEEDAPAVRARGPGLWEAEARATITAFEAASGRSLATLGEEEDVDTLGGLVFALAGRVPERGEVVPHPAGLEFEVLDADPRRIKRLRVRVAETAPDALAGGEGAGPA